MSMEISNVQVKDQKASIWELTDFVFTGATVLEKTSAAYFHTHAIAAARSKEKESVMAVKKKKVVGRRSDEDLVRIAVQASTEAGTELLASALKPLTKVLSRMQVRMDALEAAGSIEAEEEGDEDDEIEAESCDKPSMKMKKKKPAASEDDDDDEDESDDEDDEDDIDSETDDGDLEELGPEEEAGDDEPGHMNRKAANKGRKTTSEEKVGKTVASSRLKASLRRERDANEALEEMRAEAAKTRKTLRKLQAQVEEAARTQQRRSVLPAEISMLLRKGGVDPLELQASGEKLTVEQVDAFLINAGGLPNVKRMEFKNILRNNGLMEEGRITR